MRLRSIPSDIATLGSALPRFLPGGKTGALVIHGFTGTPRELVELGGRLQEAGLTVCIPRLPGHGTNGEDLLACDWRDWLRSCVDAYADLKARCDEVHIVGYSMGGVLAILLASRFPVRRLVLLAPAMRVNNPLLPLTPLLRFFIRRVRVPVAAGKEPTDADLAVIAREYWMWRYLSPAASLYRLQRKARRALQKVTAETLTIVGGEDLTVPTSVVPLIEGKIGAENTRHVVLPAGTHLLLAGEEGERACHEIVGWLVG